MRAFTRSRGRKPEWIKKPLRPCTLSRSLILINDQPELDTSSVRTMQNLPTCLKDVVPRELGNEDVLWADSPGPWAYGRRHWKTSLLGIPFTAFAVFWTLAASGQLQGFRSSKPAPDFFILWGLMFVAIGVGLLLSPLLASLKAERCYYVLTAKRALIFEKLITTKITSIHRDALSGFERISYGGKQGDLVFRRTVTGTGKGRREEVVGFLGLDSFHEAESALWKLLESRKEA